MVVTNFVMFGKKTREERIQKRQEMLEKEEEERLKALEIAEAAQSDNNASGEGSATVAKAPKLSKKKTGFVNREKAKFQMKLRIVKAIKRTRMPVQIRILPAVIYFLKRCVLVLVSNTDRGEYGDSCDVDTEASVPDG